MPHTPVSDLSWFHVVLSTYGSWLPGDPRGFRTRNHREHIEGDYKNPPPAGLYEARHRRSQALMRAPACRFSHELRPVVGLALVERLQALGSVVYCVAVCAQHVHLLAKVPYCETQDWIGHAKRHAWFEARQQGWNCKMWAKKGKFVPVTNRHHLENDAPLYPRS